MINYNIDQDKQLMQVYPSISPDKFVTAYFIPVETLNPQNIEEYEDIGEFTHFGNPQFEDDYENDSYEDNVDLQEEDTSQSDLSIYNSFYDDDNFSQINEVNLDHSNFDNLSTYENDSSKKTVRKDRTKTKGFQTFNKYYNKVEKYFPEAKKYRDLLTEIAYQESRFRSGIINRIGAAGYFQFMDSTRRGIMQSLKKSTNLNDFLNNPELQILAAVQLAKSFENSFSQNDLKIARQKGHTMAGLISGAWLGGVGGVRKYLYRGKNASDGGTTVGARIKLGDQLYKYDTINSSISWAKELTNTANHSNVIELMHRLPNFNIKSSNPQYWTYKNPTESGHNCGKAVRLYMEAMGFSTEGRPNYGGDYGPFLLNSGWSKLSPGTQYKFGDICVTKGQGKNKEGHISMYDGHQWVSDYIQSSPLVYSWAKIGTNTNFYRYKG